MGRADELPGTDELSGIAVPEGKTKDVAEATELLDVALNESVAFASTLEAEALGKGTTTVAAGGKAAS